MKWALRFVLAIVLVLVWLWALSWVAWLALYLTELWRVSRL